MTQDEAVRSRAVLLAALRESDPHSPIPDAAVHCVSVAREGVEDKWQVRFIPELINRSEEETYRAAAISLASVGRQIACFDCWENRTGSACLRGDCQAEVPA